MTREPLAPLREKGAPSLRALAVSSSRLIPLGIFGAPQGVRGEVRVKSYTQEPKAIARYGALTDSAGKRSFVFAAARPLKDDMLVVRLKDVATREAAQALTGVELFARRGQLPPPGEGEFYHDDLIGLAAVTPEGEALGQIVGLRNFGAGDILEIAPTGGGESLMLPFKKTVALEIDFAKALIVVAPPQFAQGED